MSDDAVTVGVVAEGPTDHAVFEQVAQALTSDELHVLPIQPEASDSFGGFGEHGSGWKGVRSWCKNIIAESGGVSAYVTAGFGPRIDVLVIHVDADIASDPEIDKEHPCPPADRTVSEIRSMVLSWLDLGALPSYLVLGIPSKSTEAWVLAALAARDGRTVAGVECKQDPARSLTRRPYKWLGTKQGKPHKEQAVYRDELAPAVTAHWNAVCRMCGEAERFALEFQSAVAARPRKGH